MGTYTFTASGQRRADASIAVELYDWVLGISYLGPSYTLTAAGGGSLTFAGVPDHALRVPGGGSLAISGRNPSHHVGITGGPGAALEGQGVSAALRATGMHHADASAAIEINQVQLGLSPMGPLPVVLMGGGTAYMTGAQLTGFGGGADLSGGGALDATGLHAAKGYLLWLSGGGDTTGLGSIYRALAVPCAEIHVEVGAITLGAPTPPLPADLLITLADAAIELAPDTVEVVVSNGTPAGPALFEITQGATATEVMTTQFDTTGAIAGISVPVVVTAEGTYGLRVTDLTQALTATATFTVAAVDTAATIGVPVTTPPTAVQGTTGVRKWVFQDPANGDVYHFAINPSKMTSPHAPKRITFQATTAINGAKLAFEGQASPVDWKFEGVLFEKAQYDAFVTWLNKRNRVWVTDHWGRAWLIYLTAFEPVPRRDVNHAWCHDYTISAIIFDGPVTPA